MHSNSAQFNGYGDEIRSYCPTVGVTVVIATTYETFTDTGTVTDHVTSNLTYVSAIETLQTATSSGASRAPRARTRTRSIHAAAPDSA